MGICHSYAPDGRCISLLKILLTNFCIYDCRYCINRSSSNVKRARFTVDEVVRLTMEFYKRNYIEGLFLSSGVVRSPDETMGEMVEVARRLREDEKFGGYIHLKTIPECSPELIEKAGTFATGSRSTSKCQQTRVCGNWLRRRSRRRSGSRWPSCASRSRKRASRPCAPESASACAGGQSTR